MIGKSGLKTEFFFVKTDPADNSVTLIKTEEDIEKL